MKLRTKLKSKLSLMFSGNFQNAYTKFSLKHTTTRNGMPETRIGKSLEQCTVGLLTTAGVHLKTDRPFDVDNPEGDHTLRIIPKDAQEEDLTVTHLYYDVRYAKKDPSIVFPLAQLHELEQEGKIGTISDVNIGLNGGILDTRTAERESIPKVVDLFNQTGVDIALLVPG